MFILNRKYLLITILLFTVEVCIALFVKDTFIRPYFGDVLVVILIYCFVQSFFRVKVYWLAMGVLIFAFMIEGLQYLKIIEILGLQNSATARTLIGNSFAWKDMLAYIAGIVLVLAIEMLWLKKDLYGTNILRG